MRLNGTVKFFNSMRGFGFISPESGESGDKPMKSRPKKGCGKSVREFAGY
jgi:hypothetical protein